MYCPSCGSKNQAGIKYCTRCGTNLAVVSDALSGKTTGQSTGDDRIVKLLKDYYSGRRSTLLGIPMFVCGILMVTGFILVEMEGKVGPLVILPLVFAVYGAIATFWGINHWMDASSELKALGYDDPKIALPRSAKNALPDHPAEIETSRSKRYATDPIEPGSVTERTTNLLDERDERSHKEIQPKQIS